MNSTHVAEFLKQKLADDIKQHEVILKEKASFNDAEDKLLRYHEGRYHKIYYRWNLLQAYDMCMTHENKDKYYYFFYFTFEQFFLLLNLLFFRQS